MLSGFCTKGALACPSCNKETTSHHLEYSFKQWYMGHHRFLPTNHLWHSNKSSFDNTREVTHAPKPLIGYSHSTTWKCKAYVKPMIFGKTIRKRKQNEGESIIAL